MQQKGVMQEMQQEGAPAATAVVLAVTATCISWFRDTMLKSGLLDTVRS